MSALTTALALGYVGSLLGPARRFFRALDAPVEAQGTALRRVLRACATSAYGRAHGLEGVRSIGEFRRRVPITDYAALAPFIERAAAGEPAVLSREPLLAFERSSGSTADRGNKLLPLTRGYLEELGAATAPWLYDLYTRRPRLMLGRAYWSVSPVAREAERTPGGTRIGFTDDTEYFGPLARWALSRLLAVPGHVAHTRDVEAWRKDTALGLLRARDLAFVSVWSPSFLTVLLQYMEAHFDALAAEVGGARERELRRAVGDHGFVGRALWPGLTLVSAWADGPAQDFVPGLMRYLPGVELQPKGLLATEGVVSIPLLGRGSPLAVASHFLEMLDLDAPDSPPLLAHELKVGGSYSPIISTSAGLLRYHLKDRLECTGFVGKTPAVRFLGKLDRTSDVCGEKLTAAQVDRALEVVLRGVPHAFAMLSPTAEEPPGYVLWLETDAPLDVAAVAAALEAELALSYHYRYCRDLGQLLPLRVEPVRDGWAGYQAALVSAGMRLGDIKPTRLEQRRGLERWLLVDRSS